MSISHKRFILNMWERYVCTVVVLGLAVSSAQGVTADFWLQPAAGQDTSLDLTDPGDMTLDLELWVTLSEARDVDAYAVYLLPSATAVISFNSDYANAMPFDDVAPPAGAVRTFKWQLDSTWFRDFEGTARRGGPARVQICGRQQADGSTRRWIAVQTRHLDALDATAARELGSALTEAADEMERLS